MGSLFAKGAVLASVLWIGSAVADGPLLWHGESLTYAYGKNFKVDPPIQQTITFEHASNWTWGDIYTFIDTYWYNGASVAGDGHSANYGEFSTRFSLGKISNQKISFGPVSDVLLATTVEWDKNDAKGYDDQINYLIGPGFDIKVPGFDYFLLNTYYRKADGGNEPSGRYQITPVWSYTMPIGKSDIVIDGYADWVVNSKGNYHSYVHFNPQIKYDLGRSMGFERRHLFVGVEYEYWSNKYGIKSTSAFDTNQSATSAIVRYDF